MNIKKWLEEVEKNNFPSAERQKELAWLEWKCTENLLEGKNRLLRDKLSKLSDDIKEDYDISMTNILQKDNYGGTMTTYHLKSSNRRNLDITKQDWTMMYRFNIYENGQHIKAIEEDSELVEWLNNNL